MIGVAVEGQVAQLTLDRPKVRNALDRGTVARLAAELDRLETDASVGAVVLRGAGTGFCAGSDLKEMNRLSPGGFERARNHSLQPPDAIPNTHIQLAREASLLLQGP